VVCSVFNRRWERRRRPREAGCAQAPQV
jgi:hypothetical protein